METDSLTDSTYYEEDQEENVEQEGPLENRIVMPTEPYDYSKVSDLSGVPICRICDRLIEAGQVRVELNCHHTFHFSCTIAGIHEDDMYYRCFECRQRVITEDEMNAAYQTLGKKQAVKKKKRVLSIEEQIAGNKELLQNLKIVKKSIREASVARRNLDIYCRGVKREYIQETGPIFDLLGSIREKYRSKIIGCDAKKEWVNKKARASYYIRMFDLKYHQFPIDSLRNVTSLRLPTRWRLRQILTFPTWAINHILPWRYSRYRRRRA